MRFPSLWTGPDIADPFRMMRREIDELFSDFAQRMPATEGGLRVPAVNVAETDGQIEITAELPGVDQKDIKLSIEGKQVVLTGEKKQESKREEKGWHVMERSFGSFRRAIDLPFEPPADGVEASFENGVLYLNVKKPAIQKQQQKTIEIKAGAPKGAAQITQGQTGEQQGKQGQAEQQGKQSGKAA